MYKNKIICDCICKMSILASHALKKKCIFRKFSQFVWMELSSSLITQFYAKKSCVTPRKFYLYQTYKDKLIFFDKVCLKNFCPGDSKKLKQLIGQRFCDTLSVSPRAKSLICVFRIYAGCGGRPCK